MGRKKDRSELGKSKGPGRKARKQEEPSLPRHLKTEMTMAAGEPHKLAIELAHKAAFRTGLGRSIFCPTYALKKLNSDLLQVNFLL